VLKYGADYVTNNQTGSETADIDAPVAFVGYGIHAPEYDWDDSRAWTYTGKVALVIVNEPPVGRSAVLQGQGHVPTTAAGLTSSKRRHGRARWAY